MSDASTNATQVTAEWVRRPLVELGGLSPADAAAEPSARKKLEDLLTELAGHHVRLTNLGLPAVNPQDVRKALGMEAVPPSSVPRTAARSIKAGPVKRNALLDELGTALTGGDVDSVAFFNTKTGAIDHFMHNLGEQENERIAQAGANTELRKISPVTTEVRYGIMSDFISSVEDINVAGRLRSAISGKGAFRRFREAVDEDDSLRRRWLAYRTKRHYYLALDWMHRLELKPEQYGISTSDYDWQPPDRSTSAPQETRPVQSDGEQAPAASQAQSETAEGQGEEDEAARIPADQAASAQGDEQGNTGHRDSLSDVGEPPEESLRI
ncbi:MAG: UPF0158 family protein [Candidatus Eremiobacteraeota bacterium]|nr:UPF0158 family protein [Candidatus Eremiobacteraeota bacterium]